MSSTNTDNVDMGQGTTPMTELTAAPTTTVDVGSPSPTKKTEPQLQRVLGLWSAVGLGMSSMVGTGIFVSVALAAQLTGPSVIVCIVIACIASTCNALNSAQLASVYPTSGGTYEYGYRLINKYFGFIAGWTFLAAKSASGATGATGAATYIVLAINPELSKTYAVVTPIALGIHLLATIVTILGLRKSNLVNFALLTVVLSSLIFFVFAGIPNASSDRLNPFFLESDSSKAAVNFLEATAMCAVAFTGFARICTLGSEVKAPRVTIPRAIIITLICTGVLYISVTVMMIMSTDLSNLVVSSYGAPLANAARSWAYIGNAWIIMTIGAIFGMVGVLLNLILGLSRMSMAMAQRKDLPVVLAKVQNINGTPTPLWSLIFVSVIISGLILIGNVKTTWSFSAFTVLVYYSICNLSAFRLPQDKRIYSKAWAVGGIIFCLVLAFFVQWVIWVIGLGIILFGLIFQYFINRYYVKKASSVGN